jgi:predicted dithiol-disulfide oxidoreductase (DUF899 family)
VSRVGTQAEWLEARVALLAEEKELTRRSDELARKRRELPWVPVDKDYRFASDEGEKSLADLFEGRSQLLVYHFMFGPTVAGWPEAGCAGCSFTADSLDGSVVHLAQRDVSFVAVSRAPVDRLHAYRERMGWSFPWVSCGASTFNEDMERFDAPDCDELHGLSAFALRDGTVFHTYSTFDRGTDALNSVWQLLDRAPHGRTEVEGWPRRRYEYAS